MGFNLASYTLACIIFFFSLFDHLQGVLGCPQRPPAIRASYLPGLLLMIFPLLVGCQFAYLVSYLSTCRGEEHCVTELLVVSCPVPAVIRQKLAKGGVGIGACLPSRHFSFLLYRCIRARRYSVLPFRVATKTKPSHSSINRTCR